MGRRFLYWTCGALSIAIGLQAFAARPPMSSPAKNAALNKALPEGERAVYLSLVDAYRRADVEATYKFRNLLLKNYAQSIYADNALYLTGLLDMERGRLAEAVQNFGLVIERYPRGNKRPAAMYAKSMAYSKLKLPQMSRRLLEDVTKLYPGSPESQRAWIDLRIKGKGS